jgi:hypothetical protein
MSALDEATTAVLETFYGEAARAMGAEDRLLVQSDLEVAEPIFRRDERERIAAQLRRLPSADDAMATRVAYARIAMALEDGEL